MAPATIPTTEPTNPIAGDTWRWDRLVDGYTPANGWTLTYAVAGARAITFSGVANASNTGWEITVPASTTLKLTPGQYSWRLSVAKSGERYTVDGGVFVVQADLATATAGSTLSFEERMIPILEAAIEGTLEGQYAEMQIAGRALKSFSLDELESIRGQYLQIVQARRNRGRLHTVKAVFRRSA